MLEDFESKWCSHEERNNGIDKVAEKIIEEVPDREDEMREMLEAYQEWNKKYPSNKIFSHSEMQKIVGELDLIMEKSKEILNKQ